MEDLEYYFPNISNYYQYLFFLILEDTQNNSINLLIIEELKESFLIIGEWGGKGVTTY